MGVTPFLISFALFARAAPPKLSHVTYYTIDSVVVVKHRVWNCRQTCWLKTCMPNVISRPPGHLLPGYYLWDWRTWDRNIYHLETTYYVTDLKQMMDFAWYRGSGIRLNVAARDVNLVPAYDDVIDAGSDNAFVLTNPGASSADVTRYKDVIRRHCRSVISLAWPRWTSQEEIDQLCFTE